MEVQKHRPLHCSQLRSAAYDEREQRLEIAFPNGSTLSYNRVPAEVARRFFAAPNPGAFWEDRIAEEYPAVQGRLDASPRRARAQLDALFGGPSPSTDPSG